MWTKPQRKPICSATEVQTSCWINVCVLQRVECEWSAFKCICNPYLFKDCQMHGNFCNAFAVLKCANLQGMQVRYQSPEYMIMQKQVTISMLRTCLGDFCHAFRNCKILQMNKELYTSPTIIGPFSLVIFIRTIITTSAGFWVLRLWCKCGYKMC